MHTYRHDCCDSYDNKSTYAIFEQILMVDPIFLDMQRQPIELPCRAYVYSSCLTEWIYVTVYQYDSTAPAAICSLQNGEKPVSTSLRACVVTR